MLDVIIYISTLLMSLSLVASASKSGLLNSAFSKGFAGVSSQVVSSGYLKGYTNFESFLKVCIDGQMGLIGYFFLISLGFLLIVWINNIVEYKNAIM